MLPSEGARITQLNALAQQTGQALLPWVVALMGLASMALVFVWTLQPMRQQIMVADFSLEENKKTIEILQQQLAEITKRYDNSREALQIFERQLSEKQHNSAHWDSVRSRLLEAITQEGLENQLDVQIVHEALLIDIVDVQLSHTAAKEQAMVDQKILHLLQKVLKPYANAQYQFIALYRVEVASWQQTMTSLEAITSSNTKQNVSPAYRLWLKNQYLAAFLSQDLHLPASHVQLTLDIQSVNSSPAALQEHHRLHSLLRISVQST